MERNRLYVFLSMLVIIFFFSVSGFGSYLPEEAKDAVTRVGDTAQEVIKSIEKSLSEENKDATDSDGTVNATEKQLKSPLHCLKKKRVQRREKIEKVYINGPVQSPLQGHIHLYVDLETNILKGELRRVRVV